MIKWSVTKRLIIGFSFIIFVLEAVIVFDSYSVSKNRHIENTLALAYNMKIQLLECRREEKSIIMRGLIDEHIRKWESAFMELKKMEAQLVTKGYISAQDRQLIESNIDEYGRIFQSLINDLRKGKILNSAEVSNYDERFKVTCRSIEASVESVIKEMITEKEEVSRFHLFWGTFISILGIIFSLIFGYRTIKFTRRNVKELESVVREIEDSSMQLAVGLSEIFEVLNRVATGNLDIQASGQLENELLNQLAIVVNRTIANLKELKSELERQHDWLQTTLSSIGDAVIATDVERRINFMNPIAEHLTGWRVEEAMGKNIEEIFCIISEQTRKVMESPFELLFREGERIRLPHNILLVAKDGREIPINDSMAVIRKKAGVSYGAVLVFRDITERKQMEINLIQSAKMASVGQLSAGVAHEINNPLTGVLNNVQLIKMELEQSPATSGSLAQFKEILDSIEESALRCKKITQSLLEFSHAHKLLVQPVSINEIIEKSLALIGHELKLENILLQTELPAQLPLVLGNSQLLQQVVMNIIANAHWAIKKKLPQEGGQVTIKTQYDAQKKAVKIFIADTGIGMPEDVLKRIFEPFFTTKEVGEGTGMGLSVVYGIIKEHEGKIEAESQPDKGATFKITLPALLEKKNA